MNMHTLIMGTSLNHTFTDTFDFISVIAVAKVILFLGSVFL